jgi:hypothetical protein
MTTTTTSLLMEPRQRNASLVSAVPPPPQFAAQPATSTLSVALPPSHSAQRRGSSDSARLGGGSGVSGARDRPVSSILPPPSPFAAQSESGPATTPKSDDEQAALAWLATIGGSPMAGSLCDLFAQGQTLCEILNRLSPGAVHSVPPAGPQALEAFRAALPRYGVLRAAICNPDDVRLRNVGALIATVRAMSRRACEDGHPPMVGISTTSTAGSQATSPSATSAAPISPFKAATSRAIAAKGGSFSRSASALSAPQHERVDAANGTELRSQSSAPSLTQAQSRAARISTNPFERIDDEEEEPLSPETPLSPSVLSAFTPSPLPVRSVRNDSPVAVASQGGSSQMEVFIVVQRNMYLFPSSLVSLPTGCDRSSFSQIANKPGCKKSCRSATLSAQTIPQPESGLGCGSMLVLISWYLCCFAPA